uniref:AlNc14C480G11882 protein n=1 Tax=Albugo laibachii Nc14 TaxID=890382 RepID=F0X0E2_9STRA|nr:AlNc14C480G11882 [Albugo laibachii Nc14]|eukprot:CCA27228.1 AlNc14C480G11882 [Albugo laibachii Nc14]
MQDALLRWYHTQESNVSYLIGRILDQMEQSGARLDSESLYLHTTRVPANLLSCFDALKWHLFNFTRKYKVFFHCANSSVFQATMKHLWFSF